MNKPLHLTSSASATAVEVDCGTRIQWTRHDGRMVNLEVINAGARVLYTNLPVTRKAEPGGFTVIEFHADLLVEGHRLRLTRFLPVQESFYEPVMVNGVTVWLDAVAALGDHLNENHGACLPRRAVRLVLHDADRPLLPEELRPWFPLRKAGLDVAEAYTGGDVWLGPYFGADAHGGLDVNMPIGTPLMTPFSLDRQWLFTSMDDGANGLRWRGERRFADGRLWAIQTHHLAGYTAVPDAPLPAGVAFGWAAGTWYGSDPHSHFVLETGSDEERIPVDPWMLFWQLFRDLGRRSGAIEAEMAPVYPVNTGERVRFVSRSRASTRGGPLREHWLFSDGHGAIGSVTEHAFAEPGLYTVWLVADDGAERAQTVQHVTVTGSAGRPSFSLSTDDDCGLIPWPVGAAARHGGRPTPLPNTLTFVPSKLYHPVSPNKRLWLGPGSSSEEPPVVHVRYELDQRYAFIDAEKPVAEALEAAANRPSWLRWAQGVDGNRRYLDVWVDAGELWRRGGLAELHAEISLTRPGEDRPARSVEVVLAHPVVESPTASPRRLEVVVGKESPGLWLTPGFWVEPRFSFRWDNGETWPAGKNRYWLFNGEGRPGESAVARFTPVLKAGRYRVLLPDETPNCLPGAREPSLFRARIRHAGGLTEIDVMPAGSRDLGTYLFAFGNSGYVEFLNENSSGVIVIDALRFVPVGDEP